MRSLVFPALLVVALLAVSPAGAQPQSQSVVVGFAELHAAGLGPETRYIASGLPRLLIQELRGLQSHTRTPAERAAIARDQLAAERLDAARLLDQAVNRRDQLFFRQPAPTDAAVAEADRAVLEARERLQELQAAQPRLVSVAERVPLQLWSAHVEGTLLPTPQFDPASDRQESPELEDIRAFARAQEIDLLIFGRLGEVEQYALVDLFVYSAVLDELVHQDRTVGRAREVLADTDRLASGIATVLLGRDHAGLLVTTNMADSVVAIDGVVAGYGDAELRFAEPGMRLVTIEAQGFGAVEDQLELVAGERVERSYELEPIQRDAIRIQTNPSQAAVYLNSVWQGTTPLSVPRPLSRQQVRLEAVGYFDSRFRIGPDSPQVIARDLRLANVDWDVEIREKRSAFYRSLGWFALSVPVPIFLFGAYQAVAGAFPPEPGDTLPTDEWVQFGRRGNVLYWGALGSTFATAGLLVNAFFALFDYVRVGEASHYL